jgi:hypothetical protein
LAALDARNAEIRAGKQKRDVKTSKSPNLCQCAAERCGIDATTKSGLSQCAGPCLPDIKPSFYSKDCQRAVRFCASNPVRVTDNSVYRIGRGTRSYASVKRRNRSKKRLLLRLPRSLIRSTLTTYETMGRSSLQSGRLPVVEQRKYHL